MSDHLSYHTVYIQGFECAHPNIFPIYELLEYINGLVLKIPSCEISMTQANNWISERKSDEDPVLIN